MVLTPKAEIVVDDVLIAGYRQDISLRVFRPVSGTSANDRFLPTVLYFHGGRFTSGSLSDADIASATIASGVGARVVSVGYSLAPAYPFPAAVEDGYLALRWAIAEGSGQKLAAREVAVAGHDAGGNIATCLSAVAFDRDGIRFFAQALLAPLLDPSMTRLAEDESLGNVGDVSRCASSYLAYLPNVTERMHPYAAPLESRRLARLPPAFIASAENDRLHTEAEEYAAQLIGAGVPTEVTRHLKVSHEALATHVPALSDMVSFFGRHLSKARSGRVATSPEQR